MFKREEPSPEILITVCDGNEDELHFSSREKENFRSFRALKKSTNGNTQTQSSESKPLIRRVPTILRENDNFKKYFEPRVVAIGPLHYQNNRLRLTAKAKLKFAVLFCKEHEASEQVLYKKIKEEIGYLKKCYKPKDIEVYEDDELAWIFFVDGCAMLHVIHRTTSEKCMDHVKVDLLAFAQVDLFMLENQIPFRVLNLLISSISKGNDVRNSMYAFIDKKIKSTLAAGKSDLDQGPVVSEQDQEPTHLLGILRDRLLTKSKNKPTTNSKKEVICNLLMSLGSKPQHSKTFRSVKELKEAGIQVSPSETSSFRDVDFYVGLLGTLKIPRIVVDDSTGSKFMNLVAYEMCPDFENDFGVTSYLCFLDSLIDTAEDVKELRHAGMLLNYMGSDEEVAHLFNSLTTDLVPDFSTYKDVTNDMRKYCNNPWATSIAKAYYTHFSTPWSILAFLGVLLGLVFTAIQTYYSIRRKAGELK
ncbi:hypothetical protein ERO13_A04G063500v2 [Gossypium hirsutum]|uniref:UPF0481 protein At3g47200 n=1 Tax=Gossypium hirsutum TaxID=3635 RepID=A0ABM3BJD9_GOSHI|nr:UPF0481 protein At3g47200-like [Gossypium hirsutum]KAG4204794.1 hypothetical protein ERO13_A04G063500v2 [Gossypium hirsutum]